LITQNPAWEIVELELESNFFSTAPVIPRKNEGRKSRKRCNFVIYQVRLLKYVRSKLIHFTVSLTLPEDSIKCDSLCETAAMVTYWVNIIGFPVPLQGIKQISIH